MMLNECNGCEYKCSLSHIDICTLGSPCPHQRSTPMTNEEWLRSCNTEQLAEFVVKAMILYDNSEMTVLEAIKNAMKNDVKLSNYFMESLLEWLKQPHTNKE